MEKLSILVYDFSEEEFRKSTSASDSHCLRNSLYINQMSCLVMGGEERG